MRNSLWTILEQSVLDLAFQFCSVVRLVDLKDILLKKSGYEDNMLISTWEIWREDLDLWKGCGMPVGNMSINCGKIVEWEICGENKGNDWEFCGRNVEFYPDISHIYSVPQSCSSTHQDHTSFSPQVKNKYCAMERVRLRDGWGLLFKPLFGSFASGSLFSLRVWKCQRQRLL